MNDVFGIKKIYQDKAGGPSWNGLHWANGIARTLKAGQKDTYDKTLCSENRGNVPWTIDGKGFLIFNGTCSGRTEPRFHLNNPSAYFFRDVECTMYMMRISDDNTNWAGPNCGVRSGPNGHSISSEYCDAHTYYQRLRYDGNMDFEKELKHPDSSVRNTKNIWNGSRFPTNKWVGYKSVTYNTTVNGVQGVRMELYRDMTDGLNGGTWEFLGTTTDTGGWAPAQSSPVCSYAKDYIPLTGGGVIVMRNTGVSNCQYKWMTVREIVPTKCNRDISSDISSETDEIKEIKEVREGRCDSYTETTDEPCSSGICSNYEPNPHQYESLETMTKETDEETDENNTEENTEEGWCNII